MISHPNALKLFQTDDSSVTVKIYRPQNGKFYVHNQISTSSVYHSPASNKHTLARLMGPDDANVNGNVHGGTILKLIEEAGAIAATRFCNDVPNNKEPNYKYAIPTLARIEKMDFSGPMYIGEVGELNADVTYTAHHSLEVTVKVFAENVLTGNRRQTNEAKMWYVPVNLREVNEILPVPKLHQPAEEEAIGKAAYEYQRKQRSCSLLHLMDSQLPDFKPHTVGHSRTVLTKLVNPSDAFSHGYCKGGVIMKLMDECAGITAAKHAQTPVVTACLDATNFLAKSKIGSVLSMQGVVTYTSNKSLEIQVVVDMEEMFEKGGTKQRAVEAFFTMVSLDKHGKPRPIPPLKIKTSQEEARYAHGQQRYKERQKLRQHTN